MKKSIFHNKIIHKKYFYYLKDGIISVFWEKAKCPSSSSPA